MVLVNEHDEVIGQAEKLAAHQQGLLHRAFSVMLYRKCGEELEFLLQQRALDKYHCGGLWANTCCSHPRFGETPLAAGERRLEEELGVRIALREIGHFVYKAHFDNGLTEYEFDHVLVAEYSLTPQDFNSSEIMALQWMRAQDLAQALTLSPKTYTPWLAQVYQCCLQHI